MGPHPGTCQTPTGQPFGRCYLSREADLSLLGWSGSSSCRVRNKVRVVLAGSDHRSPVGNLCQSLRPMELGSSVKGVQGEKYRGEPECGSKVPRAACLLHPRNQDKLLCVLYLIVSL